MSKSNIFYILLNTCLCKERKKERIISYITFVPQARDRERFQKITATEEQDTQL